MNYIIILLVIVSILLIIISYTQYQYQYQYFKKDTFISQRDANIENDGNMKFDYLIKNNYTKNVLDKYYLNDDKKINGKRVVNHPYQKKNYLNLYGNPFNQLSTSGRWGGYDTYSEYIFNNYGVRR